MSDLEHDAFVLETGIMVQTWWVLQKLPVILFCVAKSKACNVKYW